MTTKEFEEKTEAMLKAHLLERGALRDEKLPECPDVEDCWPAIAEAYVPDGVREFKDYPVVSLGWMMLVGMAMAKYWDADWATHSGRTDFYEGLRDMRGYDNMDEAITEDVLGLNGEDAERVSALAASCASVVLNLIYRARVEPGTREAFECYVAALHCLYLAGMRVELTALGYRMTKM